MGRRQQGWWEGAETKVLASLSCPRCGGGEEANKDDAAACKGPWSKAWHVHTGRGEACSPLPAARRVHGLGRAQGPRRSLPCTQRG